MLLKFLPGWAALAAIGLLLVSFPSQQLSAESGASRSTSAKSAKTAAKKPITNSVPSDPLALPAAGPLLRTPLPAAFSRPTPTSIADLRAMEQHVTMLIKRVSPAVVSLEVGYANGSGVIITEGGLVLTAGHVVARPDRQVRINLATGKIARAKSLGVDSDHDLGLVQITDPGPWPFAPIGCLDRSRLGDWVLALGHPGGYDAKRSLVVRSGRLIRMTHEVLQTDCTISPGDSGGPLFDIHGRVVGIHNAISDSLAANYHVPINLYVEHWEALSKGKAPDTAKADTAKVEVKP